MNPKELITNNARREWEKWKARFEGTEAPKATSESIPESLSNKAIHCLDEDNSVFEDTVGAIACSKDGRMAAGVSRRVFSY